MIADARDALVEALAGHPAHVYRTIPDAPSLPAVVVGPVRRPGRETHGNDGRATIVLHLLVSRSHGDRFETLDAMCERTGDWSVQQHVEALTLDELDLTVIEVEQVGATEVNGVDAYEAQITVEVWL